MARPSFIINLEKDEVYRVPYLGIIVSCAWEGRGGEWSGRIV